jgi:hypothetical protein
MRATRRDIGFQPIQSDFWGRRKCQLKKPSSPLAVSGELRDRVWIKGKDRYAQVWVIELAHQFTLKDAEHGLEARVTETLPANYRK